MGERVAGGKEGEENCRENCREICREKLVGWEKRWSESGNLKENGGRKGRTGEIGRK